MRYPGYGLPAISMLHLHIEHGNLNEHAASTDYWHVVGVEPTESYLNL
jgi:hypothetical protein